jgi:NADPH-dependent glutamate synthase beta subunit-like oxidoreductase
VFAGGDIVRGASTVVAAVADGMKAAREINDYLRG